MTRGAEKRQHPGESRYPAAAAVVAAVLLYAALPSALVVLGPRYLIPALELLLLVPLLVGNPRRMTRQTRQLRVVSIGLILLIAVANTVALVVLVDVLVNGSAKDGGALLIGAAQVWLTNVIVFALAYWEIDRGGPVVRTREPRSQLPPADFRFPQDEDHDAIDEVAARSAAKSDWSPAYLDYLYVSVTNSSAFSPTDTMPLTATAKWLMSLQAMVSLVIVILVVARAVGIIS